MQNGKKRHLTTEADHANYVAPAAAKDRHAWAVDDDEAEEIQEDFWRALRARKVSPTAAEAPRRAHRPSQSTTPTLFELERDTFEQYKERKKKTGRQFKRENIIKVLAKNVNIKFGPDKGTFVGWFL